VIDIYWLFISIIIILFVWWLITNLLLLKTKIDNNWDIKLIKVKGFTFVLTTIFLCPLLLVHIFSNSDINKIIQVLEFYIKIILNINKDSCFSKGNDGSNGMDDYFPPEYPNNTEKEKSVSSLKSGPGRGTICRCF
jgi:hypothetical protein